MRELVHIPGDLFCQGSDRKPERSGGARESPEAQPVWRSDPHAYKAMCHEYGEIVQHNLDHGVPFLAGTAT
jgi:hypothetical protein